MRFLGDGGGDPQGLRNECATNEPVERSPSSDPLTGESSARSQAPATAAIRITSTAKHAKATTQDPTLFGQNARPFGQPIGTALDDHADRANPQLANLAWSAGRRRQTSHQPNPGCTPRQCSKPCTSIDRARLMRWPSFMRRSCRWERERGARRAEPWGDAPNRRPEAPNNHTTPQPNVPPLAERFHHVRRRRRSQTRTGERRSTGLRKDGREKGDPKPGPPKQKHGKRHEIGLVHNSLAIPAPAPLALPRLWQERSRPAIWPSTEDARWVLEILRLQQAVDCPFFC